MALPAPGPRLTGALLITSAMVVTATFAALGSAFDYPAVLGVPAEQVLGQFNTRAGLVGTMFALLALGAAALAPIALGTARLAGPSRWSTAALVTGVAAAVVQLVGLARWPLLVPSLAAAVVDPATSAVDRNRRGRAVRMAQRGAGAGPGRGRRLPPDRGLDGVILAALRRAFVLPRMFTAVGLVSAMTILAGLLVPLGVPGADLVNFAGYLVWSAWIVWFGVLLLRGALRPVATRAPATPTQALPA